MIMTMMDLLSIYPSEIEIGSSAESFQKFLESQKALFHNQVDQLQNIVVTQCKLTGVNPLSQEMAAGALSIKIGKRPRDLLNPKAVKYMQSIFSLKDVVSKKESREISAKYGVTATQVKEFFASQRSRVRRFVRLSKEKASITGETIGSGVSTTTDSMMPINPEPLSSCGPSFEDRTSPFNEEELLRGIGDSDKHFVDDVFNLMRKEETFSGQVKLMEWIMKIENPSVLNWFLMKGGVMILATWLSQSASEEQTSILSVTLRVLCHLPLHQAPSSDISAIVQSVNRLRFYGRSDISSRAKLLLSRWSKMLAKLEATKKPNGVRNSIDGYRDLDLRQRINELTGDTSWQSPDDDTPAPCGALEYPRNMEGPQTMKLLTSSEEANKKHILGVPSSHNKERRKVLLVEQPGQKPSGKSPQVKAASTSQARPITADEIQKAKIRAQFMQSKYGKSGASASEGTKTRLGEVPKKASTVLTNDFLSASEAYLRPKLEAQKKARLLPVKNAKHVASFPDQKTKTEPQDPSPQRCQKIQIPWQPPPAFLLNEVWRVGIGQGSKEVEAQRNRNRREPEIVYQSAWEIPSNPKEPWDREMDYDDSLTLEIPIEQLPDADTLPSPASTVPPHPQANNLTSSAAPSVPSVSPPAAAGNSAGAAEPDLELLAVLLKNPELVFALTSGQASGLSSEDTMKLLDLIKSSVGSGPSGVAPNSLVAANQQEEIRLEVSLPSPTPTPSRNMEFSLPSPTPPSRNEVSLPSPTPSSSHGLNGWKPETARSPFSRQYEGIPGSAAAVPVPEIHGLQGTANSVYHQHANGMSSNSILPIHHHPSINTQPEKQLPPSLIQHSNQISINNHHQYPMVQKQNHVSEVGYMNHSHPPPPPTSSLASYAISVYSGVQKKSSSTNISYSPPPSVPVRQQLSSLTLHQNYDTWRSREVGGFDPNPAPQPSHSNFHNSVSRGHMHPGNSMWGGRNAESSGQGRAGFDSWGSEDGLNTFSGHVRQGRSYQGHRMNPVNRYDANPYVPPPGPSAGGFQNQEQHWQGNRRWSDRERRR